MSALAGSVAAAHTPPTLRTAREATRRALAEQERLAAAVDAYGRERPFLPAEQAAWSSLLRAAALRFWLSRLHDLHFPRPGEMTHVKDPDVFRRILEQQIAWPATLSRAAG